MHRAARRRAGIMAGALALAAIAPAGAQPVAAAACPPARAEGSWAVEKPSRAGITRLIIAAHCEALGAVPLGGAVREMPSEAEVEIFGECPEKECTWGRVPARTEGRDRIVLRVDQGFALRTVILTLAGDKLRVKTFTDYADARDDFGTTDVLKRIK